MGLRNHSAEIAMGQRSPYALLGALAAPVCWDEVALAEHSRGNLIPPATTTSLVMTSADLPLCSVIRPTSSALAGATAAAQFLAETGLFEGQSDAFLHTIFSLAAAADRAARQHHED